MEVQHGGANSSVALHQNLPSCYKIIRSNVNIYIYIHLYMRLIYLIQWASNVFTQLKVTEIHDSMVN